jgi:hypothetical protein
MTYKKNQNEEVFKELTNGKSLLQLYCEMKEERDQLKEERDQLAVALACKSIGIPYA